MTLLPFLLTIACRPSPTVGGHPVDSGRLETGTPDSSIETAETAESGDTVETAETGDTDDTPKDTGETSRDPFTIVVLPDTQMYARDYPDIAFAQTRWIAENAVQRNIVFVLHEGDVTDDSSEKQWEVGEQSMALLDGLVPYSVAVGNHDLGPDGTANDRTTFYDTYFPASRFENEPWYGGHMGDSNANHYVLFSEAGLDFLVLNLEFGADDGMLSWGSSIVSSFPDRHVILLTHCYMMHDDTRNGPGDSGNPNDYGIGQVDANDGEEMWSKAVSTWPNVFLVLSGHIIGDTAGLLTSTGAVGQPVHQWLANYQGMKNGGDGWLRLLEFVPREDVIHVSTYSPVVAARAGEDAAWWDDPQQTFDLPFEM